MFALKSVSAGPKFKLYSDLHVQARALLAGERDPVAKLHVLVVEYYRLCRPSTRGRAAKLARPGVKPKRASRAAATRKSPR